MPTQVDQRKSWLWSVDRSQLELRSFGDVTYAYCRLSGNTHVFNLVSVALLDYLSDAPQSLDHILETFPDILGVSREECPRGVVRRMVEELDEVGLLRRRQA